MISDLNHLFAKVLDDAEKVLFNLADNANSDEDQSLYFHSMTQVQCQRQQVEKNFSEQLAHGFAALVDPKSNMKTQQNSAAEFFANQSDDFIAEKERSYLQQIANKAVLLHQPILQSIKKQLILRLDLLNATSKVDKKTNPLTPENIVFAVAKSIDGFKLQSRAKLELHKCLESVFSNDMAQIYMNINQYLLKQGVLPTLSKVSSNSLGKKPLPSKNLQAEYQKKQSTSHSVKQTVADTGSDFLAVLRTLNTNKSDHAPEAVAKFSAIDISVLIHALSKAQHMQQHLLDTDETATSKVRELAEAALIASGIHSRQLFDKNSNDVISAIAILFDFIIEDDNIAVEIKKLIAQLQIPILKVALLSSTSKDASFFSNANHPARSLLNELTHAGIGYSKGGGVGLRDKIEQVITKIVQEYKSDTTIFTLSLLDFQTFMDEHKKRVRLIERRLQEAERGKAKAETAKSKSIEMMQTVVGDKCLPEVLGQLLFDDWQRVLMLTYLRDGEDSDSWQMHTQVAIQLLTLFSGSKNAKALVNPATSLSDLFIELKAGLDIIDYGDFEAEQLFNQLDELYQRLLEGDVIIYEDSSSASSESINVEQHQPSSEDRSGLPCIESQIIPHDEIINYNRINYDELPLVEVDEQQLISHLERVDNLQIDSWFEVMHKDKPIRCKLAAVIKSVGKYIFVDYTGKKIAEYDKSNLIEAFSNEQIRMLDDTALFDRAIQSMLARK